MAVITRFNRPGSTVKRSQDEESVGLARRHPDNAEAPDRGVRDREAPETSTSCRDEAPDAGEGRMSVLEHEFTHGRSQS